MKDTVFTDKKGEQGIGNPKVPRLLTLKEAAKYLGFTVWAVRERVWAGDIPVIRFAERGKQYLDIRDIERFIERYKETVI